MTTKSFIIDYEVHGGSYSSDQTMRIFSEEARLQRWLDVEVALAEAQAELGLIPRESTDEILRKAHIANFDLKSMHAEAIKTKHSLMPLISQLEKMCSPEVSRYIHYGATTQDIQDSAQSLEMKLILDIVIESLTQGLQLLLPMARQHANTLITGRTHSMAASPTTFGLKVASWIDELVRHQQRLRLAKPRICCAQLFGSVGTMAAFENKGPELLKRFALRLGLSVPDASWHVSRDRFAEFAFLLSIVSSTLARIADELRTLNRSEIGEIEVAWQPGEIGSSCMPHKRNPEDSEQIVVLARLVRAQVPLAIEGMIVEHERDYRGTRLEWPVLSAISHYTTAALNIFVDLISRMKVNPEKMRSNAVAQSQYLCVENLMIQLAKKLGRTEAYALAYDLANRARSLNLNIHEYAKDHAVIKLHFSESEIEQIFDPQLFLGSAAQIIETVIANAGAELPALSPARSRAA